jgi:hypothetical protein
MKPILFTVGLVLFFSFAFSQKKYWSAHKTEDVSIIKDKSVERVTFPKSFKLFDLDLATLRQDLFTVVDNSAAHSVIISLPNVDGTIEEFSVVEASNFEPALQVQFPEIRAFSGKGITDKYATLKLSISPQGIKTMIFRTDRVNEFIEPYSKDHKIYSVFRSERKKGSLKWECTTDDHGIDPDVIKKGLGTNAPATTSGQLKTMRLAQSCNGEYANYFGATSSADVALVLAAFNATISRCNGVFEKDLGVHLNLIAATTAVIYYDPATDPYTTLNSWNLQEQKAMTANIGSANYDIGHMFGASGGGGNAGCIGCVCVDPATSSSIAKGGGITSPADNIPEGDNFDIDYVVHEMGHQLGANHSFTFSNEGTSVQMEVGSGITIMGYAGITSYDFSPHSIDIFHAANINQIQTNLAGKSCPVTTDITPNNTIPVISPVTAHTIPISTPFALTASATDADGDPITYCWEEVDNTNSLTGANSNASATKASGPNWASWVPTSSPVRIFPKIQSVLAGLVYTNQVNGDAAMKSEYLSSVSRTLNFRCTARDNHPYSSTAPIAVGQTAYTNVAVTVSNTSGPFIVTSQSSNVTYAGGSTQTVTWNVASTTTAPVSCPNVKISYSTDGGYTFPTVLVASTTNNGSASVVIPVGNTTTARIKVEAANNIFFNVNSSNFTVNGALPVTFLSFTAAKDVNKVRLIWQTTNEINVSYYRVETSHDGIHFANLMNRTAAGTNNSVNTYNGQHMNPGIGSNYYRIAEVDKDGKVTYSETKEVYFAPGTAPIVTYGNGSTVEIDVPSATQPYQVRMYNSVGQEVISNKTLNQTHASLNVANLSKGVYMLDINYNDQVYHFKVLK